MITKETLKKNTLLIFGLIVLIIISFVFVQLLTTSTSSTNLEKLITNKMIECNESDRILCYKKIAQNLASKYHMKDILVVFEKNEKQPVFFGNCHTTLHFLGQEQYKINKNVSKSLSLGTPICFAGFYHGILEEYISDSKLAYNTLELSKILPTLCSKETDFKIKKSYNECLHGLGHALMYATNNNLPESLKLCDNLESEQDRDWCYSGSFMENSTSSTNDDHPSKYLNKNDPMYPCNILEKKYLNMCYTLQSFYFGEISNYDWKENERLCLLVPREYQGGCFNAIGQSQVGTTQDLSIMNKNCHELSQKISEENCLNGIVSALGERYDDGWEKSLDFCHNILQTIEEKNSCFDRIINISKNLISNKEDLQKFCKLIQLETKRSECLEKI